MNAEILNRMVTEVGANARQISAVEKLLAEGNTIPFIARYRKEAHGNLDEVAIGKIKDRLEYYTELEARKETVLKSIDEQGKLTDELRAAIAGCFVKSRLEDIYQPYKPKRRTRAQVAKEKGYEPLADAIWEGRSLEWNSATPTDEDLQFARDIIAERIADNADVRGFVRTEFARRSKVKSEVASPAPSPSRRFPRTAISRFAAARRKASCGSSSFSTKIPSSSASWKWCRRFAARGETRRATNSLS